LSNLNKLFFDIYCKIIIVEINNLIKLSYGIGKKYSNKKPNFFYNEIVNKEYFSHVKKLLTEYEMVVFSFLCSRASENENLEMLSKTYTDITNNLFMFSLITLNSDLPPKRNCDECFGSGEIECDYCDGTGEIDDETCNKCQNGYNLCQSCDGTGKIDLDNLSDITVHEYVSYDRDIFDNLENMKSEEKIDDDFNESIESSELTLFYKSYRTESDYIEGEENDVFFGEIKIILPNEKHDDLGMFLDMF
jgi:hypothetical protein